MAITSHTMAQATATTAGQVQVMAAAMAGQAMAITNQATNRATATTMATTTLAMADTGDLSTTDKKPLKPGLIK